MRFLTSSVIRGAPGGASHGGLYLVDFAQHRADCVWDYTATDIDLDGRGGDRGLRGLASHDGHYWVAATDRLLVLDAQFRLIDTLRNPYLRHCHELALAGGRLFVASTGFDALVGLNLRRGVFDIGYHLAERAGGLALQRFDPARTNGPPPRNRFHINSVAALGEDLVFSGLRLPALLRTNGQRLAQLSPLPVGTHNALPWQGGVLFNDTAHNRLVARRPGHDMAIDLPALAPEPPPLLEEDRVVARARFARGLCLVGTEAAVGGMSPSRLVHYDLAAGRVVDTLVLSEDIRNAIHGILALPPAP